MSHFLYQKNHGHSHEDDYKLGRLFLTSLRVRTRIKWTLSSCKHIHSDFRNGHMYAPNKQEMSTKLLHDAMPFNSNFCKKGLQTFQMYMCAYMYIILKYPLSNNLHGRKDLLRRLVCLLASLLNHHHLIFSEKEVNSK